jgi:uncharacterized membrane protein
MRTYDVLLFLHISFAIVWIGSGTLFHILGFRADRVQDENAFRRIIDDLVALSNLLFVPSALLVLVLGILLTIEGPWSFTDLWIVLGLVGFGLTFVTGSFWIGPQSKRIKTVMERDGGMSAEAYALARRMMLFARLDYAVLFAVVFDMAVKPDADDIGALVLMAAAVAAAAVYFGWRARSIEVPGPSAPEAA